MRFFLESIVGHGGSFLESSSRKGSGSRSSGHSALQIEPLEDRQMLAADVGWVGSYFAGSTPNATPTVLRHDALIDFDWGERSPLDNVNDSDGFSARWESHLRSDHTATHQLILRTNPDDGLRLWVDSQLTVDAWDGAGTDELIANVSLVAGQAKDVRLEYRDITGQARLWVGWTSPELPKEVVGPEWTPLSAAQQDLVEGASTRGALFEQLAAVGSDFLDTGDVEHSDVASGANVLSFNTTAGSTTHPAQRTRGYIVPENSGTYQFRISGGDASRLLLADDASPGLARVIASADSPTVPGQWSVDSSQTSAPVKLLAGVRYYFEARQTESGTYEGLDVQWKRGALNWEAIPHDRLRPVQGEIGVRAVVSAVNETDDSTVLTYDVSRTDDFGRDLVVDLNYGGTAIRDVDYSGAAPTVTIPAGHRSASVDLTVVSDGVDEVLETIEVSVAGSGDYALTSPVRTRTTLSIFGNLIPAGNSLIADDPLDLSNIASINGTSYASFSNRTAVDENGGTINGTVLVVDTTSTPPSDTSIWARWDINQDVAESETLYAEFYYRRVGTLWSQVTFNVRTTSPFRDFGKTEVTAKGFWQRAQIPISLTDPILSSASRVEMFLGTNVAQVEIANFEVKRFVDSIDDAVAALPVDAGNLADTDIRVGQGTFATFTDRTTAASEQVPFNNALTVDVHTTATFLTQIRAGWYSDIAIEEGSIVTVEVWLRTDDSPFDVRLQVEQSPAVNRNLLRENLSVTNEWTKHQFTITARQAAQPGELRFEALFGRSLGTLEIGGIQIWDQGAAPDLTQHLPQSYQSYAERDADSDWRWEARENVLANRRHPLTVNVTNLAGAPISGATVEVDQIEHSYGFGNILRTEFISDIGGGQASDPASQRHAAIASRLFNTITIANGIRWVPWDLDRERGIDTVDWVNDNVDSLHGHHLTWGQLSMIPSAVRNEYNRLRNDVSQAAAREYLRTEQLDHVADIASELGGTIAGSNLPKVAHWDTVNHPVLLKEIWNILRDGGPLADPIGEVFDAGKANSHPDTLQMINEGQTIEFVDIPRRTEYYNLIADLLADGKPVEAVGFMNHFGLADAPSPTQFNAHLDEFATLGLPLGMTEFDINSTGTDLQTQADWSEDYFLNVFANPATEFIIGYGFYQLAHWRHDVGGHWYNSDWEAKPNGEVFVDQVHREWQTNTVGSTRTDGTYQTLAFDGRQQVTVTYDGQTYEAVAEVDPNGGVVNIQIDSPTIVDDGTRIEAEWFDAGGQGIAYHDTTPGNTGGQLRLDEDVDIGSNNDGGVPGYNVGWIQDGEWLEYSAGVVAGCYDISARVASANANAGSMTLQIGDGNTFIDLGTVDVEETGGWDTWTTLSFGQIDLAPFAAFDTVFRLEMTGGQFNVNWFEFATPLPGDYNRDAIVDQGDLVVWQNTYGSTTELAADGNCNGIVDAADFTIWRDNLTPAQPPIGKRRDLFDMSSDVALPAIARGNLLNGEWQREPMSGLAHERDQAVGELLGTTAWDALRPASRAQRPLGAATVHDKWLDDLELEDDSQSVKNAIDIALTAWSEDPRELLAKVRGHHDGAR